MVGDGPPTAQTGEKALYTLATRLYGAPRRAIRRGQRLETKRMDQFKSKVPPADGKLAVLLPGMGAVATTFIAGVENVRRGSALPARAERTGEQQWT